MEIVGQSLKIGAWQGAPILMHWSILFGLWIFGGPRFAPVLWLSLCLLIIIHELGHAYWVRRYRMDVEKIVIHGFGGYCSWRGDASRFESAVIAWGGVLAQALLLPPAFLLAALVGVPAPEYLQDVLNIFIGANIILIAVNLIPIEPLDGAKAWPLIGMLWRDYRRGKGWKSKQAIGASFTASHWKKRWSGFVVRLKNRRTERRMEKVEEMLRTPEMKAQAQALFEETLRRAKTHSNPPANESGPPTRGPTDSSKKHD